MWSECNVTCSGGIRNRTCVGNGCSVDGETQECNIEPCKNEDGLAMWVIGLVAGMGVVILIICFVICIICIILPLIKKKQIKDDKAERSERPEEPIYVLNVVGESNPAYGKDQFNCSTGEQYENKTYTEINELDIENPCIDKQANAMEASPAVCYRELQSNF